MTGYEVIIGGGNVKVRSGKLIIRGQNITFPPPENHFRYGKNKLYDQMSRTNSAAITLHPKYQIDTKDVQYQERGRYPFSEKEGNW